ncbi:MAG: homoserine dehydrogenase, partial [Myxococcota bacterium]
GIINGTTNYILSKMQEEGGSFEEILIKAQELGYAEADPSADVDGFDAADKIGILAALGFNASVDREDIFCQGIRDINATDIEYAKRLGFVIKLLAIAKRRGERLQVCVHPTLVPKAHPLASIHGVNNALFVESSPLGEIMLFGPGAGKGPTACAVVADLLTLLAHLHTAAPQHTETPHPLLQPQLQQSATLVPMSDIESRFYLRLLVRDQPGVIGDLGVTFGKHQVNLESVVQINCPEPPSSPEKSAEIVVITDKVKEQQFQDALQALSERPSILQSASVIRAF